MDSQITREIFDDIYTIKVPLPRNPLKNINVYLIKGEERNLIIDTAFNLDYCYEVLKGELDGLGVDMAKTDIFITHLHSDHTGLVSRIASESTKIYMSEKDSKYMVQFFDPDYWARLDQRSLQNGFSAEELEALSKSNPASTLIPDRFEPEVLHDGDTLTVGARTFTCIETPGHTPGHMCLYDPEAQLLFSGDHIIFDISPNITAWETNDHSLKDYFESLQKVKSLKIEHTLSAHRESIGDCYARISELIAHHEDRLEEATEILRTQGMRTAYDVAAKMTWSISANNWADFPVAQKWFAAGEATSHLEYLRGAGIIERHTVEDCIYYCIKPI